MHEYMPFVQSNAMTDSNHQRRLPACVGLAVSVVLAAAAALPTTAAPGGQEDLLLLSGPADQLQPDRRSQEPGDQTIVNLSIAEPQLMLDEVFNPGSDGPIHVVIPQPDGRLLVGGTFDRLGGLQPLNCARLLSDGTGDPGFDPRPYTSTSRPRVLALVYQTDGRTIAAGKFAHVRTALHPNLAAFSSDGVLEMGVFSGLPDAPVNSALQLSDGSLIIGGAFTRLGDVRHGGLARFRPDGTLDPDFYPGSREVYAIAVDDEGRILVGGTFSSVGGQPRSYVGRLLPDGTLDEQFAPMLNSYVFSILVQADGRILVGGLFETAGGDGRTGIVRLNPDGTVDPTFLAGTDGTVYALSLQANGKIIVAGEFTELSGEPRSNLGRLLPDGTVDSTFVAEANGMVYVVTVQPSGDVIVGGEFTQLHGVRRERLGRLLATEPAESSLLHEPNRLVWLREGSGPEVWRTVFEHSVDRENWTTLGPGVRIPGGWEWEGESVPEESEGWVRARGYVAGGQTGTSSWYVQDSSGTPYLLVDPHSRTNDLGASAMLEVVAQGSQPLRYQWYRDGEALDDDHHVSGSNGNVLRFRNLTGVQDGVYTVTVSNAWGTITSQPAVLTVNDPLILAEPDDHAPAVGESITLSVEATSSIPPLSYQWWKDGEPLPDAVEASLELVDVQVSDAGRYWVVVSCPAGATSSSIAGVEINGALPDADFQFCLNYPYGVAMEPDGAILVAGHFDSVGGTARTNLVRFLPDNTVDASFTPELGNPYMPIGMLAVQPDGRILFGERFHFARCFPDGTLDGSFAIDAERIVEGFGLQPDGRMVTSMSAARDGYWQSELVRWLPDGTAEPGFNPECTGLIWTLVLQPDGKIVVGGPFRTLAGTPRSNVGRLNPDGTLDESFTPDLGPHNNIATLVLQPDGKILVGGSFSSQSNPAIKRLARFNSDGTWDSEFKPDVFGSDVSCLSLQANGKILVGGSFTQIGGHARNGLARLLPDGRVDLGFNPSQGYTVCLGIQKDGKILAWGENTTLMGETCSRIGRLFNPDAATESLEYLQDTLTWMRGGGSPEVWRTTFEYSSDGTEWTPLGAGTRIPGGWQLAAVPRPESGTVRARGYAVGGDGNASTWFVETLLPLAQPSPPQILLGNGSPRFTEAAFVFDVVGTSGATVVVEVSLDLLEWVESKTVTLGGEPTSITDPDAGLSGQRFYRIRALP